MYLSGIYCNRTTRISTTTDYGLMYLDEYGISTSGSTYITFQVQACSDVHIALKYQTKEQPIEIVIGGWRNTRSCIRLTPQDNCSVTTMGAMLDCAEYRQFTLYWTESQIFVKNGNRTAEKSNIFLNLPLNFTISDIKVGISTGYGFSGKWMLEDINCLQTTCFSTSTSYGYMYLKDYGISTSGSTFITFMVQACSDAHIALSSLTKEKPIEIVISGWNNTQSCIRLRSRGDCSVTTLGAVLDCREYRPFTVYWGDGNIRVKKGNSTARKSNIFLSLPLNYNLDDFDVGISTGFGSSGRWIFEDKSASVTSKTTKEPMAVDLSVVVVVTLVGAVVIFGIIIGVFMSLKKCKKTAKSPSSASSQPEGCTKASIEPDRQHRLGIASDHLYDSITDTSAHTYMALRQQ